MSAQFNGFLQALSLQPVNDSVVKEMFDTVIFQGVRINISELGPEVTQALPRLMEEDLGEEGRRQGESGRQEVSLFESINLPPVSARQYLTRRVEHNVVLLAQKGSSRRALKEELTVRMESGQSSGPAEIFAVSWAASTSGSGECSRPRKRKSVDSEDDDSNISNGVKEWEEEEKNDLEVEPEELVKVSEFLKWKDKYDIQDSTIHGTRHHGRTPVREENNTAEEGMEEDNNNNNCKKNDDKDMRIFIDICAHQGEELSTLRLIELDDVENPDIQFANLCRAAGLFTVHWLQAFPDGFIWKKSRGPGQISRLKLGPISYQEENWLPYLEHKAWQTVICISGIARMGKSTFLASMAHRLKSRYRHRLVCFIRLERLSSFIDGMNLQTLDILKFADLLVKYFNIVSDIEQSALKCLLYSLDGNRMEPKMELLMDGLETMSARARQILLDFFTTEFSSPIYSSIRVWLTTRPHVKHEVESAFSIVAYDLDGLNSADLESFFKMQKCQLRALDLFSMSMRTHLKINLGTLLGIPKNMLGFMDYMKLHCPDMNPYRLNANTIMKDIIMKNVERTYQKHYLFKDTDLSAAERDVKENKQVERVLRRMIPLASQVCSRESEGPTHPVRPLTNLTETDEADILNFGILSKDEQGRFYFVHASYPAYILAQHFCYSIPKKNFIPDFFLNCVLCEDSCDLIRQFYEESLMTGVNTRISAAWTVLVRNSVIKSYHLSTPDFKADTVEDTTSVLDLAIIDQRLNLAKLILRSFASEHTMECRRLIQRRVKVGINDICLRSKQNKTIINLNKFPTNNTYKLVKTVKRRKLSESKNGMIVPPLPQFVVLSALSLAIMFGDRELVHAMYVILGKDAGNQFDMGGCTLPNYFHFPPLHLAVIGCNPVTFQYLTIFRKISPNKTDNQNFLPIHMVFYNRWVLKFPGLGLKKCTEENREDIVREVHICKYYNDQLDPEWNERVGQVADRAGHLPLLSSCFVMGYTKMLMKNTQNFFVKRRNEPRRICYYKSSAMYVNFAESLSGRTLVNFQGKLDSRMPVPFHWACSAGYLPVVKAMVARDVRVNIRDKRDRTALYASLCKQQLHVVQYLLEMGINRDVTRDVNGIPLIHHLSLQNLEGALGYLVKEFGVPVDLPSVYTDCCTPLHMACIGGSIEAAQKLLRLGADANAKDEEDFTPLLHAIHSTAKPDLEMVDLLISHGADVNASRDGGKSCLHQAILQGDLPLMQCLLPLADVNAVTTDEGQTPLHFACKHNGGTKMLELLVEAGAKIDVWDKKRETPLFVLCKQNSANIEMAIYLLKQGASIDQFKSKQSLMEVLAKRNPELGALMFKAWKPPRPTNEQ